MNGKTKDELMVDHNHDGIDRRGFLKCMAWAGTGTLCVMQGGVLKSYSLSQMSQMGDKVAMGELSFVQISDSHMGFDKPANPNAKGTLEEAITHVKALPGNPYDGHTLAVVLPEMETQIGATIARVVADRGYRGHNAPPEYRFQVYTAGQKRRVTPQIKREFKRRAAVEPVIGHLKAEHRMGCNHLAHRAGDAINAMLAAVGYNFHILLRWLSLLLRATLAAQLAMFGLQPA